MVLKNNKGLELHLNDEKDKDDILNIIINY